MPISQITVGYFHHTKYFLELINEPHRSLPTCDPKNIDRFAEGSVTNMSTSIVGNLFGFKAMLSLHLKDLRIPPAYVKSFQGTPHAS